MSPQFLSAALVRGIGLVTVAAVIGGLVLDLLILRLPATELAVVRARLRRWITICLVAVALASVAELFVRAQEMSRLSPGAPGATAAAVLTRTHFGAIWTVRGVALVLAVLLSLGRSTASRALALVLTLGIALTISLTGHAADWGDLTVAVAIDWAHVVAASAWTGGLIGLTVVAFRRGPAWPPELLGAVGRRFSRLAGPCLLVVVLTGTYNAWAQLGTVSALWASPYGRVLVLKLLAVAALAGFGAVNRWVFVWRLSPPRSASGFVSRLARMMRLALVGPARGPRSDLPRRFIRYVARETLVGLAVFAFTAALGESTPGRHAAVLQRVVKTHPTAKVRPSDAASGAWTFTAPAGNVERGRTLFAKLECFTCHAVRGERVPPPTRPGPDLTGVGSLHPAYLVESIMNPNAMIVDGPGYTGADGRSIMPDYRERLTVSELIDLVAYLRSLEAR